MRRALVLLVLAACGSFGSNESSSGGTTDAGTTTPPATPPGTPPAPPPGSPPLPELFMQTAPTARSIALTGTYVYVTSDGNNDVFRRRLDGTGSPKETFRHAAAAPLGLAVNGTTVFLAESGGKTIAALDEGDPTQYAPKLQPAAANDLVWAGGALWWTANDDRLYRSDAALLNSSQVGGVLTSPLGIAATADKVFFAVSGGQAIYSAPLGGGNPGVAYAGENDARAIAVSSAGVFWTLGGGKIRAALSNLAPADLVTDAAAPTSIAADATHVYWQDDNGTHRIQTDRGGRAKLGAGSTPPGILAYRGVALTSTHVYWIDSATGDVWRLPK